MSTVFSLRLGDEEIYNMDQLIKSTGLTAHAVFSKAIDYYLSHVINSNGFDVICDFRDSIDGINTNLVQTFIEEVNEFTCFETAMYLDGDKIAFNIKNE